MPIEVVPRLAADRLIRVLNRLPLGHPNVGAVTPFDDDI